MCLAGLGSSAVSLLGVDVSLLAVSPLDHRSVHEGPWCIFYALTSSSPENPPLRLQFSFICSLKARSPNPFTF